MNEANIKNAVVQFETLLREQLQRQERLSKAKQRRDFASADRITIGLVDGDGIGPIIMREAKRVLCALLAEELESGQATE